MITPLNLFHTPEDWDELMVWIHQHNDQDKAHLTADAAMAWNLSAKIVEDYLETENNG